MPSLGKALKQSNVQFVICDEWSVTQETTALNVRSKRLKRLNISNNKMATKEAGKALAQALASNSVLKELDVSSNNWNHDFGDTGDGPGFAKELADGLSASGALTSLDISNNSIGWGSSEGVIALAEAIKGHVSELRFV